MLRCGSCSGRGGVAHHRCQPVTRDTMHVRCVVLSPEASVWTPRAVQFSAPAHVAPLLDCELPATGAYLRARDTYGSDPLPVRWT